MKSKLQFRNSAAICILLISLTMALAQPTPPQAGAALPGAAPILDPTTGLPVAPSATAEPQWIDSAWPDPDIVLTNVVFDNLPLSEVANQLRERFKDHFDILPMPTTFGNDWGTTMIQLQLKNVKASDVFNAMNLVFENDRTPLRWELKMNVNRPIALLRVLPEAVPSAPAQASPPETHRMVYFVGNLIGDEKSGGMTMDQIVNAILEAWPADFGKPDGVIQFHAETQMLVVNGTRDQNDFIHQVLAALQQKAEWERFKRASAGSNLKTGNSTNGMHAGGGGGGGSSN